MAARTRNRAKFDFHGRPCVWWVDGDRYLRISSRDKKFVIANPLVTELDNPTVVEVIGSEFPGLEPSERRPVWLVAPPMSAPSMGARVNDLLTWSFGETRTLERASDPPCSSGRGCLP